MDSTQSSVKKFPYQNYSNPINPSTTINFTLKEGSDIKLFIYDATGKLVDVLVDKEFKPAGEYKVRYMLRDYRVVFISFT